MSKILQNSNNISKIKTVVKKRKEIALNIFATMANRKSQENIVTATSDESNVVAHGASSAMSENLTWADARKLACKFVSVSSHC